MGVAVAVAVAVELGVGVVSLVLRVCRQASPRAVWGPKKSALLGRRR